MAFTGQAAMWPRRSKHEGDGNMDSKEIHDINGSYWDEVGNDVLQAVVLPRYGAFTSEQHCRLLPDVAGKRVLEIGCGDGQSLCYMGERQAAELWGIDLSASQLERARQRLTAQGLSARLIHAPMEEDCGLPTGYFDLIYSIYALGWTTDLTGTLARIASYLAPGGVFVFSWSHPIHKCTAEEGGKWVFQKRYFDESWYDVPLPLGGGALKLSDRKLSTYINALARAGLVVESLVEETDEDLLQAGGDSPLARRARLFPITFVIKATKR
jgi:SAM-dependent methyltransferase